MWTLILLLLVDLAWLAVYRLKVLADQIPEIPRTISFATTEHIAMGVFNPRVKRYVLKRSPDDRLGV